MRATMKREFFYDTYAILAFLEGNNAYQMFFTQHKGITTFGNLLEAYYITLREHGQEKANLVLEFVTPFVVEPEIDDASSSMAFRLRHKKKNLSYVDCLGYSIAKRLNIPFLTGDKAFKSMENVRFIPTQRT